MRDSGLSVWAVAHTFCLPFHNIIQVYRELQISNPMVTDVPAARYLRDNVPYRYIIEIDLFYNHQEQMADVGLLCCTIGFLLLHS